MDTIAGEISGVGNEVYGDIVGSLPNGGIAPDGLGGVLGDMAGMIDGFIPTLMVRSAKLTMNTIILAVQRT